MVRKKSAQAHHKVLEATLALFAERGIDASSMDAIAESSGVSKAIIYKHWPDKDALALEALALLFGLYEERPEFASGDLHKDFIDALTYQPAEPRQELKDRIMPHVMAYAARNCKFGETWRSRIIERPQTQLTTLLKRGLAQGNLARDLDLNAALALLLGPMLYWRIFVGNKSVGALPRDLATKVVDAFWKAYSR